ncbi:zinc finger and BTB domain-containing protein 5 [Grus japonensis]|uniref:Zinc finger and BTB domain-containing protein 5 n=1 Tax=Grus japonensis TaxID=30415 RepID=A0ABC9W0B4_GRUJA
MEDPTLEQVEAPEGGCGLWEAHAGASSWQDLWTHGERSSRQSRFAGRTCDPVGDPRWSSLLLKVCTPWKRLNVGAVGEELQPVGRTHVGEVWEGLSPMRDTSLEQGQSVRSPPPEEEGAAETTCDELTTTPIPPVLLGGRK